MFTHTVESTIVEKLSRIVNQRSSPLVLGNFKFGEIVCQIRSPFPEWQASLSGEGEPDLQMFNERFRRLKCFLTSEDPQLAAKVFTYSRTKELAMFSWENLPPTSPGRKIKSFWRDGYCYVVQRNLLARFRMAEAEIDILVPSKMNIAYVDIAMRFALSVLLAGKGGFILHSSGLVHADKALLFFGMSGSGKSTIAQVSQPDSILSDEAVIIQKKEGRWLAYGTPFSGTLEYAGDNVVVDLTALIKISKAPHYKLCKLPRGRALHELLKAVIILDDSTKHKNQNLCNAINVVEDVPVYELEFMPESAVWPFVLKQLNNLWRV